MVKIIVRDYGGSKLHEHYCPGCGRTHQIAVDQPFRNGAQWSFNGDFENPTFSPSVNINPNSLKNRCHYFIRDGQIQFCSDSQHGLAGKTVPLPEIPEELL